MTLSMTFWFGAVLLSLRHPCSYADDCVCRQQSRQNLLRRTSPVRRSFNGGGSCFQLPTPQRQAPFAPSGPPGLRGTHLRFAAPHPLLPVIHKVHLALLRVTPKPPQRGMYAALRAKEEIVHPASLVDPSTPSAPLSLYAVRSRSPHSASFTNSPLSGAVWVAAVTATSRFSLLCAPPTNSFIPVFVSLCVFCG